MHAITRKGNGYAPAENDEADRLHAVGVIDPETGRPVTRSGARTWTSVFADEMVEVGASGRTWPRSPRRCAARWA